ncbi:hypothetical protein [Streptomyces sp. OV198]|jgi:hypothetical protein|uniref:hypothetical protein n=1 Tax=Streptomyces sp. OV198 TaxID=1882787 RepID=UPI00117CA593|nr:hypothetical protein [Streptomyces sp. OV198]
MPELGGSTSLGQYRTEGGRTVVPVRLMPGGSTVMALDGGRARHAVAVTGGEIIAAGDGGLWLRATEAGRYRVTLDNGTVKRVTVPAVSAGLQLDDWTFSVDDWHRGSDGQRAVTTHRLDMDGLKPWSDIPELQDVSGVGTYRITVWLTRFDGPTSTSARSPTRSK